MSATPKLLNNYGNRVSAVHPAVRASKSPLNNKTCILNSCPILCPPTVSRCRLLKWCNKHNQLLTSVKLFSISTLCSTLMSPILNSWRPHSTGFNLHNVFHLVFIFNRDSPRSLLFLYSFANFLMIVFSSFPQCDSVVVCPGRFLLLTWFL